MTFDRRVDADRWLAANEIAKARSEWIDPNLGRSTFAAWAEQWQHTLVDLRPATRDRDLRILRVHLIPHFGAMPLAKITRGTVVGFVSGMLAAGDHAPATVRKIGQVLNKVLRAAAEAGLIAKSPCDGVRLPAEGRREMAFLTPDQVNLLATAVGPEWEALVLTAAYTGLRWGELAGLRVGRFDLARRTVTVVEQLNELSGQLEFGPPKTTAARRAVSLPVLLTDLLAAQLERSEVVRSGLVFPTPVGEPMRRSNFARRVWAPAVKSLELDGLRFHDLRHTAVAMAIAQGAHPKTLQHRMGHSSVTVTLDRYGHLYDGLDAQVADSLDQVMRTSRGMSSAPPSGPGGAAAALLRQEGAAWSLGPPDRALSPSRTCRAGVLGPGCDGLRAELSSRREGSP